ncbi:MAG: hypothetical protein ACLT16_11365 [[Clostridium] innocuum]
MKDMLPYTYDGVESYWFRLMITKAENCYQLPSYHHIPLIQHSRWEYDYGNSRIYPKSMRTYANGESQTIENGHSFLLFPGFPVQRTSMYFLFNQSRRQERAVCLWSCSIPLTVSRTYDIS